MSYFNHIDASIRDGANLDAFGRLRVSQPHGLFDAQFTYNLQPLLFEQLTSGTGASISHDTTNRCANMSFSATTTGYAYMQTYEYFRYQPGKSQQIFITFNFNNSSSNPAVKFAQYGDDNTYFRFYEADGDKYFSIGAATTAGNQIIIQDSWNIDKLDGTGKSGITLDTSKCQIFVLDFQALYVGRVRMGFDIDGQVIYCHEFNNANLLAYPYIQTANLPIRVGMTTDTNVTTTMLFVCCTVNSEDPQQDTTAFRFTTSASVTAGNGTRTHLLSIQPRTTFNSITNRSKIELESLDLLVTGNSPVFWEMCVGQAFTGSSTSNVNATYGTVDTITGTLSGSPAIVFDSGHVASSNQTKGFAAQRLAMKYPITLNAAGSVRDLGRITLLVQGIGASSAVRASLTWKEIR